MKESLLTILKNRDTKIEDFRKTTHQLASILAFEIASQILEKPIDIHTPLKKTSGKAIAEELLFIPILRAGMALLPAFLTLFGSTRIGFIGSQRDIHANAKLYYEKIPHIQSNDRIIILDPMIATGGTAILSLQRLIKAGANPSQMTIVGMIGAPEGVDAVMKAFPKVPIQLVSIEEGLNDKKYIIPGLGDFGERFFGC